MYQLKRFKFREWREIHSEVNGHNTLHVLLRLCFIFDLGLRLWSKSHLSSCTVLRFKSQSSPGVHELDSFLMKSNWSMDSRRASIKLLLLGAALFMGSDQKSFEVTSHPVLLGYVLWIPRPQQQLFFPTSLLLFLCKFISQLTLQ